MEEIDKRCLMNRTGEWFWYQPALLIPDKGPLNSSVKITTTTTTTTTV